jgi:hypothetical protein
MASTWYIKGLKHALDGDITAGVDAANLKAALVESTYTFDATDEIIGDVSPIAATSGNLTGQATTIASNVLKLLVDATITWLSVAPGAACNKVVIYWESGVAGTRYLLACDELAAPVTPDGNNVVLTWGATGIATLTT